MSVRVGVVATVDLSVRHVLLNQLLAIQRAGFDVAAISADGPDIPAVEAAGIRHLVVPFTRRMAPFADLRATWHLYRLCRRERFTIVHTHFPKPGIFGQIAARLAGVPIIVNTLHGFFFHDNSTAGDRRLWVTLERIAARCSSAILSQNSEDVRTAVRERICRRDQITALGNGIDVRRFDRARLDPLRVAALRAELGLDPDEQVVGFVGRLVREKGIDELFEAVAMLRSRIPRLRLVVVGPLDTDKRDAITLDHAARHGIADMTVFAGFRDADLPEIYSLMDVLALPSHREGFPRTPMEASAMGVPCVATDIRGCRESVRDGVNGLLVPVRDPQALADAIARILSSPDLAASLSAAGVREARERFDERLVFDKVISTYTRLLEARGLPAPGPASEAVSA